MDFQIMPFMVQNKNQIASNTHKYKKIKSYIQAYISENVTCKIFDKKSYKENSAPNTQEQVWGTLIPLLYQYRIYIKVPSSNQCFYR